jgi:hypothetical protein
MGAALGGFFDFRLEDVIRINESVGQRVFLRAHIALRREQGNGLRHRAGMTLAGRRMSGA